MSLQELFTKRINEMVNDIETNDIETNDIDDITAVELHDLVDYLDPADYEDVTDMILDFLDQNYEDEIELDEDDEDEDLDEAVSRKFKGKARGVRKFTKSKSQLRKDKVGNKKKKASYAKGRNTAIKKGQHTAKVRRG